MRLLNFSSIFFAYFICFVPVVPLFFFAPNTFVVHNNIVHILAGFLVSFNAKHLATALRLLRVSTTFQK